jgi:diaminopimelate decarboxylase
MSDAWTVQGIGIVAIAESFGTPLYVYDCDVLRDTLRAVREALPPQLGILYSLKANPNVSIAAELRRGGAGAEVSSLAELVTALRAGVQPEDVLFLGPGKSREELGACLDHGIAAVVCESLPELALLDDLARERGTTASVVLRINPSFSVKGSGLTMGGKPRQFGIDEQVVLDQVSRIRTHRHVRVVGVHVYLGTRVLTEQAIVDNTRNILDLAERLSAAGGFPLELVDVGGGLGVAYFDNEEDLDLARLGSAMAPVIDDFSVRHPETRLVMELGRYLVARAGTYVTRVRYVKDSFDVPFAVADGGTNHHMAAVGVGSFVKRNFPVELLSRAAYDEPRRPWHVSGPLCTPNDLIAKAVPLPDLQAGDLIGVTRSGAYGPTASPGLFLSHGYPAEVLVADGVVHLVRERDTVADILRGQVLADRGADRRQHHPHHLPQLVSHQERKTS